MATTNLSSRSGPAAPEASRREPQWFYRFWFAWPTLIIALCTLGFRYTTTVAEPDLERVMMALVYGDITGLHERAGSSYGLGFSFGHYKLLYALAPAGWLADPDHAAQLINAVGVAAGLLAVLATTLYLAELFGMAVAVFVATSAYASPMSLPVVLSGHPLILAAALLFAGGWIIVRALRSNARIAFAMLACSLAVLTVSLTVRAECIIAFPFLAVGAVWSVRREGDVGRAVMGAACVLSLAFLLFLLLQRSYVGQEGGGETFVSFARTFMSVSKVGKGMAAMLMSFGLAASLFVGVSLCLRRYRNRLFRQQVWLVALLALPALLLWLPNPQPARHFFFVVLAGYCLLALVAMPREVSVHRALVCALAISCLNQVVAELVRPLVVSSYQWSYASHVPRRATQQAPLGAFALDQAANQQATLRFKNEALAVARSAGPRLIILADRAHYIVAELLYRDPTLRLSYHREGGLDTLQLQNRTRLLQVIEKNAAWPRDVAHDVLEDARFAGWPIYVQTDTISRFDRTAIPVGRKLKVSTL